jgi:hypothetical protein
MHCADRLRAWLVPGLVAMLAACGGGNSSVTTITGGGTSTASIGPVVAIDEPQGANTTEIIVDSGPATGFSLGVANLPYVTVTVCAPGSSSRCVTIDHVFLDTGSIGFRVLRSEVAALELPLLPSPSGSGTVVECYPFVVGAVWGPMARADLAVGGELASGLPIQIIDDDSRPIAQPTADCQHAANGQLLNSVKTLQAKAVLGVGMLRYDCGLICDLGDYTGGYTLYYHCEGADKCTPAAVPTELQVQNPVTYFPTDNNGTIVILPPLPELGASLARGRLVFGIGTQANNQLAPGAPIFWVESDPSSPSYLYLSATMAGVQYANSYIDSGSNALFFDDTSLSTQCTANGSSGGWYCPPTSQSRMAQIRDGFGTSASVDFTIANAELLFATSNTAYETLGGAAGAANPGAFVWGLSFFYGRSVYTSIWGQSLSTNGPWYSF